MHCCVTHVHVAFTVLRVATGCRGESPMVKINLCKSMFSGAGAPDPFIEHGSLSVRALPFIVMNKSLPWEQLCRRYMIGHITVGS